MKSDWGVFTIVKICMELQSCVHLNAESDHISEAVIVALLAVFKKAATRGSCNTVTPKLELKLFSRTLIMMTMCIYAADWYG